MDQKVRCKRDQNSYAGYVPNKTEKINLNKKIFSTAFETIVANADHNYLLDPINKVYLGILFLKVLMLRNSLDLINSQIRFHNFMGRLKKGGLIINWFTEGFFQVLT